MKKSLFPLSLIICLAMASCKKEPVFTADFLVFGYFNFAWGANCESYKLTPTAIFEQSSDCKTGELADIQFDSIPMSDAAFLAAKELLHEVPESLFSGSQTSFEGSHCDDCGGYGLLISRDGVIKSYSFGQISENWPEEVDDFYEAFSKVLDELPK